MSIFLSFSCLCSVINSTLGTSVLLHINIKFDTCYIFHKKIQMLTCYRLHTISLWLINIYINEKKSLSYWILSSRNSLPRIEWSWIWNLPQFTLFFVEASFFQMRLFNSKYVLGDHKFITGNLVLESFISSSKKKRCINPWISTNCFYHP
jgi:hypothetical protein